MKPANLCRGALVAVALAFAPLASHAGAITIDAGWYGFCFGATGSPATAGCPNEGIGTEGNPFTFTATGPVLFQVTDAFQAGDTFDVWINSIYAFTTNAVPVDAGAGVSNPDLAFADPTYSHGQILLGAGVYSINVFTNASPFEGGGAYLQVITARAVPEPATLLLMSVAALGLALARRARMR